MSTEQEGFVPGPRTAPGVGMDKWRVHARRKLASGYTLIYRADRRAANLFRAGKGYEPCPYRVAARLVRDHDVRPIGAHHLGTIYVLSEDAAPIVHVEEIPTRQEEDPLPADDLTLLAAQEGGDNLDEEAETGVLPQ